MRTMTLSDIRRRAAGAFAAGSWPTGDEEAWRRTSLRRVPLDRFKPYPADGAWTADFAAGGAPGTGAEDALSAHLSFRAGRVDSWRVSEAASRASVEIAPVGAADGLDWFQELLESAIDEAADRIQIWHYEALTHGVVVRIPAGVQLQRPILVDFVEAGEGILAAPHLAVRVEEGARAEVFVRLSSADHDKVLVNAGVLASVGADAGLGISLHQDLGASSRFFLTGRVTAAADAEIRFNEYHSGALLAKTMTTILLDGPGAGARLSGAYLAGAGRHVDVGTVQRHRSRNATSNAIYKGAVFPGGRTVYQGLITVDEGAEKTDAYLSNKNLVLGKGGRADSIPKLNIKNNDVRCTHGSTTGRIDPAQLFYLESRGLPKPEAERLIVAGFFDPVFAPIPNPLRESLALRFAEVYAAEAERSRKGG